jgi:hypothetical protein
MKVNKQQIEQQKVTTKEVTGQEAEELLRKYGYSEDTDIEYNPKKDNNLTFEEMIKRQENNEKAKKSNKKPITFDGSDGYKTTEKNYNSNGLGIKIQISSNMDIPK